MIKTPHILLFLLLLFGCQSTDEGASLHTRYVKAVFKLLDQHIINEKGISLDSLERDLLSKINHHTSKDAIHQLLRQAVRGINKHSDLFPPNEFSERINTPEQIAPRGRIIYDHMAYVYVPPCEAIDSIHSNIYTDSLQSLIRKLYNSKPAGWIIDLRDNSGGNMYAMIAGMGPLFPQGDLGYQIGKTEEAWYFKKVHPSGEVDFIALADSADEFPRKLPIVGLINEKTASAAEGLAISLKCYPKSILIGQKTYGIATGNESFFLSDSACLNITTTIMADCNNVKYPNGVRPNVEIDDPLELFDYAASWINKQ